MCRVLKFSSTTHRSYQGAKRLAGGIVGRKKLRESVLDRNNFTSRGYFLLSDAWRRGDNAILVL